MYRYGAPGSGRYREHCQSRSRPSAPTRPRPMPRPSHLRRALRRLGLSRLPPRAQLARRARSAGPPTWSGSRAWLAEARLPNSTRRRARRPALSPLRALDNLAGQAARRERRCSRTAPDDRRLALRGLSSLTSSRSALDLDATGVGLRARPHTGARPRLLLPHDLGVRRADETNENAVLSPAAAATTTSSRRSAGRRHPAFGFGAGIERLLIAHGVKAGTGYRGARHGRRVRRCGAARASRKPARFAPVRIFATRGIAGRYRLRRPVAEGPADTGRPLRERSTTVIPARGRRPRPPGRGRRTNRRRTPIFSGNLSR